MSNTSRTRATQVGALAFIAVALTCAALAAFLVNRMISAKGYTGDRVRPVVVARHALPAARPITPDDVQVVMWPEKSVSPGVVSDVKTLFADNKLLVPTTAILQGEPIVPSRLASSGQGTGLAALVRDGYRAVAVKVDESVGRARLVYPGAYVDVLATLRDPQGRGPSTRIAVADVKVLGVESETDVATRSPRQTEGGVGEASNRSSQTGTVVTLEVTPEDAEILSLAAREGRVDLALRNGSDRKPVETRGAIPLMFSAFAPDTAIDGTPIEGASSGPAAAGRSVPMRGGKIELRAVDSRRERRDNPDRPNGPSIETYRAR
jgi:pilus assembly protein CpaB